MHPRLLANIGASTIFPQKVKGFKPILMEQILSLPSKGAIVRRRYVHYTDTVQLKSKEVVILTNSVFLTGVSQ